MFWIPIVLILLAIVIFALLAGMPFGRDKQLTRTQQPQPNVVTEQEGGGTTTITEIRGPVEPPPRAGQTEINTTTVNVAPDMPGAASTAPQPPPVVARQPSAPTATIVTPRPMPAPTRPVITPEPPRKRPVPEPTTPVVATPTGVDITEAEAENLLRRFVASRDYYHVDSQCIGTASQGFKNRGYTIDLVDRCGDRGRLGRWRVDSMTREIFVQKGDGRFLRP